MEVEFADDDLDRLETDPQFTAGFARDIVKAFRKAAWFIRQAPDERDFYALRGLRFERLKGGRAHQYSMRLNNQWRLILEFTGQAPNKTVRLVCIEDYH